jgi:hypothetical protein
VAQSAGISLASSGSYQQQAAQVIASEILVKSLKSATAGSGGSTSASSPSASSPSASSPATGTNQDTDAQTMLAAYATSGFLNTTGQPATQATLAVVVTPQNALSDGSADPLAQVLPALAQELAATSAGTVVAGSSAGSGAGSPIAVLRSNNVANQVSTVDDADLASGQTVVIQALATLLTGGKAASYGFADNGASAVAPSPAPVRSSSSSSSSSTTPAKKGTS